MLINFRFFSNLFASCKSQLPLQFLVFNCPYKNDEENQMTTIRFIADWLQLTWLLKKLNLWAYTGFLIEIDDLLTVNCIEVDFIFIFFNNGMGIFQLTSLNCIHAEIQVSSNHYALNKTYVVSRHLLLSKVIGIVYWFTLNSFGNPVLHYYMIMYFRVCVCVCMTIV